jgi:valyl-tRNA synthetase
MPFITEELWAVTAEQGPKRTAMLALSAWSSLEGLADDEAEAEIGWVIELITAIRSIRAEMNITATVPIVLAGASAETQARADRWADFIKRLARVSEISSAPAAPKGSVQLVVRGEVAALPLVGIIDLDAERARLAKEMQKAEADIARSDNKLGNPNFVARAAEEVVEEEKEKREEAVARKAKIAAALESLKGA